MSKSLVEVAAEKYATELTKNPKYTRKTVEVPVSQIQRYGQRDQMQDAEGVWRRIAEVKYGYKYVTILDPAGGTIVKRDREDASLVKVRRTSKTKATHKAEARLRQNLRIAGQIDKVSGSINAAIAELQEEHDKGYQISHWRIDSIMAASREEPLWEWVKELAEDESEDTLDLVDAYKKIRKGQKALMLGRCRSLSRSTSVTSNLMEDVEQEVRSDFIQFLDRYGW